MRVTLDKDRIIRVIYVPGLGDKYDIVRRIGLWLWRFQLRGARVTFVSMKWSVADDSYEAKVARIADAISNSKAGEQIVLIGESAGGGMVLANWLNDTRVDAIVTVCGKNKGRENISETTYRRNPAFRSAMIDAEGALADSSESARARVLTVYSPQDTVVPPEDTLVHGAREMTIPTGGHGRTIVTVLFAYAHRIIKTL